MKLDSYKTYIFLGTSGVIGLGDDEPIFNVSFGIAGELVSALSSLCNEHFIIIKIISGTAHEKFKGNFCYRK